METVIDLASERLKLWLGKHQQELLSSGLVSIAGYYSGSGDEGFFDGVECEPNSAKEMVPREIATWIEEIFEEEIDFGGDGEGGGGCIELNVVTGKLLHRSYWNEIVQNDNDPEEL